MLEVSWHAECSGRDCYNLGSDACRCDRLKGNDWRLRQQEVRERQIFEKYPIRLERRKAYIQSKFMHELIHMYRVRQKNLPIFNLK